MKKISILFLGASKRVELLERFQKTASKLDIVLDIYSCEIGKKFYPISHLAQILEGPKFDSEDFQYWLKDTMDSYSINLIIPNMDDAAASLSIFNENNKLSDDRWAIVSNSVLCKTVLDKEVSHKFFQSKNINTIENNLDYYPKIMKPKCGYGAKGIKIIKNQNEFEFVLKNYNMDKFIIQDYIHGQETTVDLYISKNYGLVGYVLRDRLEVSDGEVMVCKTRMPTKNEIDLIKQISDIKGWLGCITLQYITDANGNIYLIEINARFGGGATCGIEAGLDMPTYIFDEFLGKQIFPPQKIKSILMTRARKDYFYEI